MISEIQILKTMGLEHKALSGQLKKFRGLQEDLAGAEFLSDAGKRKLEEVNDTIEVLNDKLKTLMEIDPGVDGRIGNVAKNISVLSAAITETRLGLVALGGAIIKPIEATTRLGEETEKTAKKLDLEAAIFGRVSFAAFETDRRIEGVANQMAFAALEVRNLDDALNALQRILMSILADMTGTFLGDVFKTGLKALPSLFGGAGPATTAAGTSVTGTSSVASFAHGGSFVVGGRGGVDRNLVPLLLTRGEQVDITPAGRAAGKTNIVINNYGNDEVQVDAGQGLDGNQLVEIVIGAVRDDFGKGGFDRVMRNRFGANQQLVRR